MTQSFSDKDRGRLGRPLPDPIRFCELTGEAMPDYEAIARLIRPGRTIFFIGIGGISMCGLAEFCHRNGVICHGSDPHPNQRTAYLSDLGLTVRDRHEAAWIDEAAPDLVVYSKAVFDDNPERLRAAERGIPCVERAVFLGAIAYLFRRVVNISGTNGKSTATAMCALMLIEAGLDPTVHLGAELIDFKTTIRTGQNRSLFLSEACEFRRGFYHYRGDVTVILNLVHDHIDCYPTAGDMLDAFARYVALQPEGSTLLLPAGDPNLGELLARAERLAPGCLDRLRPLYMGRTDARTPSGAVPDYAYDDLVYDRLGDPSFTALCRGRTIPDLTLRVPGEFNVQNALAAIAVADLCGADDDAVRRALASFRGAEGRFTRTGYFNDALVIVDYAHHPSAVRVTIEAARHLPARKLHVCFQPLTHSRVRGFFDDFVEALRHEDPIMMSEIYDDRERDASVSSKNLCDRINELGGHALFFETNEKLEQHLRQIVEPGDVLLIMGVDLRNVGDRLTGRTDHMKPVV